MGVFSVVNIKNIMIFASLMVLRQAIATANPRGGAYECQWKCPQCGATKLKKEESQTCVPCNLMWCDPCATVDRQCPHPTPSAKQHPVSGRWDVELFPGCVLAKKRRKVGKLGSKLTKFQALLDLGSAKPDDIIMEEKAAEAPPSPPSVVFEAKWSCSACTFENDVEKDKCDMCNARQKWLCPQCGCKNNTGDVCPGCSCPHEFGLTSERRRLRHRLRAARTRGS